MVSSVLDQCIRPELFSIGDVIAGSNHFYLGYYSAVLSINLIPIYVNSFDLGALLIPLT